MAAIGMVGVGGYGATILRAAHEAKNVKLSVVHDVDPERARAAAEKTGAKVATSYEEMLRDDSLQGVILVVPNPLHRKMLEAAVDAADLPAAKTRLPVVSADWVPNGWNAGCSARTRSSFR